MSIKYLSNNFPANILNVILNLQHLAIIPWWMTSLFQYLAYVHQNSQLSFTTSRFPRILSPLFGHVAFELLEKFLKQSSYIIASSSSRTNLPCNVSEDMSFVSQGKENGDAHLIIPILILSSLKVDSNFAFDMLRFSQMIIHVLI